MRGDVVEWYPTGSRAEMDREGQGANKQRANGCNPAADLAAKRGRRRKSGAGSPRKAWVWAGALQPIREILLLIPCRCSKPAGRHSIDGCNLLWQIRRRCRAGEFIDL